MELFEMYCGKLASVLMNKTVNFIVLLVILNGSTVSCSTSTLKPKQEQVQARAAQQQSSGSNNHTNERQAKQSEENPPIARQTQQARKKPDDSNTADIKNVPTEMEKGRQIEHKFDASLGQFDDMLLKKKTPLMMQQPTTKAISIEGNPATQSGGRSNNEHDNKSGSNTHISGSGRNMAGEVNEAIQFADDDIVARQIREAAEKELDPQLKKKLWAEYDKYKSGN